MSEETTLISDDLILRSSVKVDFDKYPKFDCSFAKYVLDKGGEQLKNEGDKIVLRNADLALGKVFMDNVSLQTLKLSEFIQKAYLATRVFYSLGLKENHTCMVYLPNSTEFHVIALGAWLCGAVVSPADYSLKAKGITMHLEEIRPKIIVCCIGNKDNVTEAVEAARLGNITKILIVSLIEETEDRSRNIYSYTKLMKTAEDLPEVPRELNSKFDPEKVALLVWSSGTTGSPKAIQIQNKGLRWFLTLDFFNYRVNYLQTTCFFHAGGFFYPLTTLTSGATINFFPTDALESPNRSRKIFAVADKFKPDYLIGGSHHVMRMTNEPETSSNGLEMFSIKKIAPVGSEVPHNSYEKLKCHFPELRDLCNFYGITEMHNRITASSTPKCLGHVYKGTEVKIADPETEEPLGPNKVGEIMARFPYVMKGYLNRPEENTRFFGKDGFVHTGDLGHYDKYGILYFNGRLKDVIKFRNIQIHPVEIEDILLKHPHVKEVGVFGTPSDVDQELVTAAVVKEEGFHITEEELKILVGETLEDSKQLRGGVVFVNSLPRNQQGKLLRKRLIDLRQ